MTTKDAAHWRDKYLDLLDEQETEQRQFKQQLALLEKALLRVSLAAEGYDDTLDQHLSALRDTLREEGSENLEPLFKPLEQQLLITDEQRAASLEKSRSALQNMLISLREAAPAGELRDHLKYKAKEVNRTSERAGGLAELLEQVAELQLQVLGVMAEQANVETSKSEQPFVANPDVGETAENQPIDPAAEVPLEGQLQTRDEQQTQSSVAASSLNRSYETTSSPSVSDDQLQGIFPILTDLLNQVEPPADCVAQKAVAVRRRLENGLAWSELVPTLEDIRDLIMQAYLAADEEHRQYLLSVDQSLQQILSALGLALEDYRGQQQAEDGFVQAVNDNMNSLSVASAEADDMESLKQHVDHHLSALQNAVKARQAHISTQQSPLSEQLSELVRQIQAVEQEANKAKADLEEQRQKAVTDSLTQLPNREAYVERAHHEMNRWQRYERPLTLAVTDIDHFKRINDTYGHQAGDRVLQVLAKALKKRLREVDFIARYGGEEFVILLPETTEQDAHEALDKIRHAISTTPFRFREQPVTITLSIGLSGFREGDSVETVFARADQQLYVAKEQGRNLCLIAD